MNKKLEDLLNVKRKIYYEIFYDYESPVSLTKEQASNIFAVYVLDYYYDHYKINELSGWRDYSDKDNRDDLFIDVEWYLAYNTKGEIVVRLTGDYNEVKDVKLVIAKEDI